MTVLANPLVHGVPVLIADTVLTTTEIGAKSVQVPTFEDLSLLKRPISSFCRKVYILDKKLAVGWAGSRPQAQIVIPALKSHIRRTGVSEQALMDYLRNCTSGSLKLLGWIAEGRNKPRPFWWSSASPQDIVFDENDVEGLGEPLFKQIFFNTGASFTGGGLSSYELAAAASLAGISRLLTVETTQGLPLKHGFGFCYDVAVWCGYRFKYIPSYTQLNVDFTYDTRTNGGQHAFRSPFLIYNSLGQSAAFSVVRYSSDKNADQSHNLSGTSPIPIPPLWLTDEAIPALLRLHSEYICAFLHITDELGRSVVAPYCITREAKPGDGMWLSKQGTLEIIQFNTGIVTAIHRAAFDGNQPIST
jgi:hypothetical protein